MPDPIHAAESIAIRHGILPDRRDVLQAAHTWVVRLTDTLVARIVNDPEGPRAGMEWFARETSLARYLTSQQAPIIPLHTALPPIAYEEDGFAINFWEFVPRSDAMPRPEDIGTSLHRCHEILRGYPEPLPALAILHESLALLETPALQTSCSARILDLLHQHLLCSVAHFRHVPSQALHGDAHPGNLVMARRGLLWTDWEDAFAGPVEWDLASILWNARIMDSDHALADGILRGYQAAGGLFDEGTLHHALIARAAVMSVWYPILYPAPTGERAAKWAFRLDWLANQ